MNISWIGARVGKLTFCTLFCWLSLSTYALGEVKWFNAADEGEKEFAKAKLIVMYFHADWCGYCKKLEDDVFTTEGFQSLGDKAMFVMFDDKNDERSSRVAVEEALKVESYPTLIVMKRDGKNLVEVNRIVGTHPAEEYLGLLRPLLGVENPVEQKLPASIAGLGLTPDSNICQPGDLQCIIGKPVLATDKLLSFEELLKTPAPKITPPTAGKTLDNDSLAGLIKELGYTGESIPSGSETVTIRFTQEENGWQFPTDAVLSTSKARVWVSVSLGQLKPASEISSEKLLKLLEFNNSYGPTHFFYTNGTLYIARAIDNVEVTKESLAFALSELRRATRETVDVWQELKAPTAAQ